MLRCPRLSRDRRLCRLLYLSRRRLSCPRYRLGRRGVQLWIFVSWGGILMVGYWERTVLFVGHGDYVEEAVWFE